MTTLQLALAVHLLAAAPTPLLQEPRPAPTPLLDLGLAGQEPVTLQDVGLASDGEAAFEDFGPLAQDAESLDDLGPNGQETVLDLRGGPDLELVVYEVADLVDPLQAPWATANGAARPSDDELAERRASLGAQLVDDARRWMTPALDEAGTLVLTPGGALVANLSTERQAWLRAFVDLQRRASGRIYVVETQFVSAESAAIDMLALTDQTLVLGQSEEARRPLEQLRLEGGVELLTAPRVSLFARHEASIEVVERTAYVREYALVVVAPGNQQIVDPIVDVVEDGVRATTRVVPLPGEQLGLVLDVQFMDLEEPIGTREVTIGSLGTKVTIGVPKVRTVRLETRTRLVRGETLVVSGRVRLPDGSIDSPLTFTRPDGTRRESIVTVRVGEVVEVKDPASGTTSSHLLFSAF
jgi:hypothetical protein